MKCFQKFFPVVLPILISGAAQAQSLQFHYDLRHTVNSKRADRNYPTLYFEYFKPEDTAKSLFHPGPFLFKAQMDFTGEKSNLGQFYTQIFQQFRFWRPKVFLSVQYSGGLGVTTPRQYSYYIVNAYSIGVSVPFKLGSAFVSGGLDFKTTGFSKVSHDLSCSFYFYQGLFHYKAEFSGDFTVWTQNRDHGDASTTGLHGKLFLFFAEPQLWVKYSRRFAIGTKINMYYHIITGENVLLAFPALAVRCKF